MPEVELHKGVRKTEDRRSIFSFFLTVSLLLGIVGALLAGAAAPAFAQQTPLLMEGKKTLYQRVLVRPGTPLVDAPGHSAPANAEPLPPLTLLYVYKRIDYHGKEWLEVAHANQGPTNGWVAADRTIDWKQSLVLEFTNPANRERSLFFRDEETLGSLIEGGNAANEARGYRATATSGEVPPGFAVSTAEPANAIDFSEQFYLLPILEHDEAYFDDGFIAKLLKVAIVNATEDGKVLKKEENLKVVSAVADKPDPAPVSKKPDLVVPPKPDIGTLTYRPFKAGVVFVVDTTTSMQPYIERTREAVQRIQNQLAGSKNGKNMCFGIVGFRDNVDAAPGLGYVTNIHLPLKAGCSREQFDARIGDVRAATSSSKDFREDSYAGTLTAITDMDWGGVDGRWVILVTDAGARSSTDPLGRTGQDAKQLNILAQEKDIAISVLHLETPAGRGNHKEAEKQYRELSKNPVTGPLYFGVPNGDIDRFGSNVDSLASMVASDVSSDVAKSHQKDEDSYKARRDKIMAEYERAVASAKAKHKEEMAAYQGQLDASGKAASAEPAKAETNAPPATKEEMEFQKRLAMAGYAMRLKYLGREAGTKAPSLYEGWVSDVALEDPSLKSMQVRVLLTRNQLSDLQQALKAIVETAERTRTTASEFFSQLQEAAALMSRDPGNVGTSQVNRLADVGALGEYLEGLPYKSKVLEIDEATWLSWSFGQQREFLDELEAKIRNYQEYHDDTDLWISLDGGRVPGDAVYPVKLEALP
ncbi:vWA domain-containing protein [Parvibaculum sp.]|uniref:vWA domain-containing protein n=1 Tax=Parvibaculum sp. TaxID=2024848 RepID=UPI000C98445B|nr:vWA domain-containing protein [Parvibaculum sp.]MAB12709.1 serine/threonine protein kinase [Parvibaculum sp.]